MTPSPSNPDASADAQDYEPNWDHQEASGIYFHGDQDPHASPTTLRSAVPAPPPTHTPRQSGVYTHKQLGGGGDASLPGVGTHTAPPAIPPLTRRTPFLLTAAPQPQPCKLHETKQPTSPR